ncbi:TetR/AcrR family transcriptional regulator [Curtobacterium sp. YC1]|uniref:TetR/AcrR family transcriptional regulator n=1 Tax=Curtobacterium sp. YC1 TaxID=2795488 RepID=UPI0018E4F99F|nr:helix-turn-helix domain-containing protein [Curtobacterium sp. YC1]QQD75726.1 TetR/AcrR family transcriptional regulator [Curtobacterium sp. YC1]
MPSVESRATRRTDPLSRDRLVQTAIEILDTDGEDALTFRSLAARLTTGPGAIYHHVASKRELLRAATTVVVSSAVDGARTPGEPLDTVRALALAVFDAIDAHPWVGTQLTREPWQFAVVQLFEAVGVCLQEYGLPKHARFDAVSALVNCVLGSAGQYAAAARHLPRDTDRGLVLRSIAREWERLDPSDFPFMHAIAAGLDEHDDREQFLAGVDLVLAGIRTIR